MTRNTISWESNAPSHWPPLVTEPLPVPNPKTVQERAKNLLMFIAAISELLGESLTDLKVASVDREYMFPWGFLNVPVEIEEAGKRYPIFFFEHATEANAAKYYAASEILPMKGVQKPIYYAPKPLPETTPVNPLQPFNLDKIRLSKTAPSGTYAAWWATDEIPKLGQSKTATTLLALYDSLDGIYSYIFGMMALALGLGPKQPGRLALPDREINIPLKGPEYKDIFLSASREKGLRFHFNTETCTPEYRDTFLALFLEFVKGWKHKINESDLSKDPPDQEYEDGPRGWFRFALDFACRQEETTGISYFGAIEHEQEPGSKQ